jgi:hypothetical protein
MLLSTTLVLWEMKFVPLICHATNMLSQVLCVIVHGYQGGASLTNATITHVSLWVGFHCYESVGMLLFIVIYLESNQHISIP